MIELIISVTLILCFIAFVVLRRDPLLAFEPITDEELLLLTQVEEKYFPQLLKYVRTLEMPAELQVYLKDKKDALETISYFMMLQVAKKEKEKRDKWATERTETKHEALLSHSERMILQRLKHQRKIKNG